MGDTAAEAMEVIAVEDTVEAMEGTAVEAMEGIVVDMEVMVMARERLKLLLVMEEATEAMEVDMVGVMEVILEAMVAATEVTPEEAMEVVMVMVMAMERERLKLKLSQATDTEVMVVAMEVMEDIVLVMEAAMEDMADTEEVMVGMEVLTGDKFSSHQPEFQIDKIDICPRSH